MRNTSDLKPLDKSILSKLKPISKSLHKEQQPETSVGIDAVFVVDTTGSMDPFVSMARDNIYSIALSIEKKVPVRLGLIEYRDHPPEDTILVRSHGFAPNLAQFNSWLKRIQADGGGDMPEAVLDGLDAATKLLWRTQGERLLYLVGDAPPHGFMVPLLWTPLDHFPSGCPCQLTVPSVCTKIRDMKLTLHAISLSEYANAAFKEIAKQCFGSFSTFDDAASAVNMTIASLKEAVVRLSLPQPAKKV